MPKNFNRIYLRKLTALEKKYGPKVYAATVAFRKTFITAYKEQGREYALQRLQLTHIHSDIALLLQAMHDDAGPFGARLSTDEIKQDAGRKDNGFGTNERWINAVRMYLKTHLVRLIQAISDTMRDDIIRLLDKAVENGWSIEETVTALEDTGLMRARARLIVRTELGRAMNVGHAVGAADSPYEVNKTWVSGHDKRVRHSHRQINKNTVDELAKFEVPVMKKNVKIGVDLMLYPGDATASPGNTINCRCRCTFRAKRDEQGNIIMRRTSTASATVVPMNRVPVYTPAQIAAVLKNNIIVDLL